MHTWHDAKHLPEKYRYGVNFGISLSTWDFIFGTAFTTHDPEKVELGIADEANFPKSFWKQSFYGFKPKRGSGAAISKEVESRT